jgi:hypothetical protein
MRGGQTETRTIKRVGYYAQKRVDDGRQVCA